MAQPIVNVREAKAQLSKLLAKLDEGEQVIIKRRDKTAVRLALLEPQRSIGWAAGVVIDDNFDILDADIAQVFGAGCAAGYAYRFVASE